MPRRSSGVNAHQLPLGFRFLGQAEELRRQVVIGDRSRAVGLPHALSAHLGSNVAKGNPVAVIIKFDTGATYASVVDLLTPTACEPASLCIQR